MTDTITIPQVTDSGAVRGMMYALRGRYRFLDTIPIGRSVLGREIFGLLLGGGNGPEKVLFAAAFHGQEWLTALTVLRLCENICEAMQKLSLIHISAHPAGTRQAGFHRLGFSPPALWGTSRFYRGFCAACLSGARPRRQPGGPYPGGTRRLPCPVDKPRVPYRARRRPAGAVREHFDQSDRFS